VPDALAAALQLARALHATGLALPALERGQADLVIRLAPGAPGEGGGAGGGTATSTSTGMSTGTGAGTATSTPPSGAEPVGLGQPSAAGVDPVAAALAEPAAAPTEVWIHAGPRAERHQAPFLVDRAHPLALGLALDGVAWSVSAAPPLPGRPVIEAGGRALLAADTALDPAGREALRIHLLAAPPPEPARGAAADNDLFATDAWPVLVANLVELARDRLPGVERASVPTGASIVYRPRPTEPGPFELVEPGGTRRPEAWEGGALRWLAAARGRHRVLGPDGREAAAVSVHFADPRESDLGGAETRTVPPAAAEAAAASGAGAGEATPPGRAGVYPLAPLLALGALLALVADWRVLARRPGASSGPLLQPAAPRLPGGRP
jgi:hypothetical protein